ncbi:MULTISPECIES: hypothetical protein [unclassified Neisseria]|uniref:hypothetical protein n=1 Tax=unclassified Neisseria TaxID=2623750 RepID=UPI002666A185|nr:MULTISPECIES: hypothetical protein [unclassified Neisseria]MDO1509816.1 hypothetical protein [Neisseria sp. MVDL19-042950]MDO1515860.1 hypothetical protein [Neisseria sp. MVDL18-041461]MDO1562973.1 hypothetical protein [Neisseria sp. MVDL20-010259]
MTLYNFILKLFKIWKGSVFARLALMCISAGIIFLGVTRWWEGMATSLLEKYLDLKVSQNLNTYVGIFLIALGFIFALMEYKSQQRRDISDNLAKTTEQNATLTNQNAFLTFKSQQEEICYSILRNLINKFQKIRIPLLEDRANEISSSYSKEKLVEYIEFILLNPSVEHQHRVWFFNMRGEGQTGKPLLYQFIENYKQIIDEAQKLDCTELIKGSPLNNAYRNVIDENFIQIRKDAYWEDYI